MSSVIGQHHSRNLYTEGWTQRFSLISKAGWCKTRCPCGVPSERNLNTYFLYLYRLSFFFNILIALAHPAEYVNISHFKLLQSALDPRVRLQPFNNSITNTSERDGLFLILSSFWSCRKDKLQFLSVKGVALKTKRLFHCRSAVRIQCVKRAALLRKSERAGI